MPFPTTPIGAGDFATGQTPANARDDLESLVGSHNSVLSQTLTTGSEVSVKTKSNGKIDTSVIDVASQAEAEAGTEATKIMTPQRVKEFLDNARIPQEIWAGNSTAVTAADILSHSGFSVVPGRYFFNYDNVPFTSVVELAVLDISLNNFNCGLKQIIAVNVVWVASSTQFRVEDESAADRNILKISYLQF